MKPPKIIDAPFTVVSGPKPRFDPFRGLSPLGRLVAMVLVAALLVGLRQLIYPPIDAAVSALLGDLPR